MEFKTKLLHQSTEECGFILNHKNIFISFQKITCTFPFFVQKDWPTNKSDNIACYVNYDFSQYHRWNMKNSTKKMSSGKVYGNRRFPSLISEISNWCLWLFCLAKKSHNRKIEMCKWNSRRWRLSRENFERYET